MSIQNFNFNFFNENEYKGFFFFFKRVTKDFINQKECKGKLLPLQR